MEGVARAREAHARIRDAAPRRAQRVRRRGMGLRMVAMGTALGEHPIQGAERMSFDPKPAVLTGKAVRLEPLRESHFAALQQAAADPAIWTYLVGVDGSKPQVFRKWFEEALASTDVPF